MMATAVGEAAALSRRRKRIGWCSSWGGGEGLADSAFPVHGDGVQAIGVAAPWTQWRRRGHRKFW
jgi:hypothetical protein